MPRRGPGKAPAPLACISMAKAGGGLDVGTAAAKKGRCAMDDDALIAAFVLDGKGGGREVGWDDIKAWRPGDGVLWVHLDRNQDRACRWVMY